VIYSQIPLTAFVLTNAGEPVTSQVEMLRERIRTVGISLLGGHSGVEGIRAVNSEDTTKTLGRT
jgi:NADH dehydrogenase [ubiquinone] 1 alpha subcomplex assembly factor 1